MADSKKKDPAKLPEGAILLEKDTKVIATAKGYYGTIREAGDVFYAKKGTVIKADSWLEPVDQKTPTGDETKSLEDMTVAELKIALKDAGVDFAGITKKDDLIDLLARARAEDDQGGDDLA